MIKKLLLESDNFLIYEENPSHYPQGYSMFAIFYKQTGDFVFSFEETNPILQSIYSSDEKEYTLRCLHEKWVERFNQPLETIDPDNAPF